MWNLRRWKTRKKWLRSISQFFAAISQVFRTIILLGSWTKTWSPCLSPGHTSTFPMAGHRGIAPALLRWTLATRILRISCQQAQWQRVLETVVGNLQNGIFGGTVPYSWAHMNPKHLWFLVGWHQWTPSIYDFGLGVTFVITKKEICVVWPCSWQGDGWPFEICGQIRVFQLDGTWWNHVITSDYNG